MDEFQVGAVARRFFPGDAVRIEPLGSGHIHDTWLIGGAGRDLVLQRLNDSVFPDVVQMVDNCLRVTAHLSKLRPERPLPQPVRAENGSLLVYDGEGRPWRAVTRIPGALSPDVVVTPELAGEVGRAFGAFLVDVQSLPGPPLAESIPHFKDFELRQRNFEFVVDLDPYNRAGTCQGEILEVRQHHRLVKRLIEAMGAGWLPERIVHNDAKAANVLVDVGTGKALCVVDLDTVAPGTVLFDVGDLLRSATVTVPEDADDPGRVAVRDDLLSAVLDGYLCEAGDLLTRKERSLIPLAGPLMAYESAMRFLTDHLAGDAYFRVSRPRHNLDRARAQLRILAALEQAAERVAALTAA